MSRFPKVVIVKYSSIALVYDTKLDRFHFADPLPIGINGIIAVQHPVHKSIIYAMGGEGDSLSCYNGRAYGQHLNLLLRIDVKVNTNE